ncbi:hypothetical protein P3X46_022209 [Hevea brasiliensis]|uniref:Uncharacterized protein n=1 Tax=Hevea brasiliensis TaxID=3981 RepID=A0ABQ9L9S3_HEVBR|nr:uncharacterized protein LOC131172004 [Hevea brasiliensis]KAJ9162434.1 hypothetical protein P3X46_022209 [Hevea brasiliensis]
MSTAAFSRGAPSMFSKPMMIRKAYHRKSTGNSSSDHTLRETSNKVDGEEMKMKKRHLGDDGGCRWVPHGRTGIFYPEGQEKVMEDIPPEAAKDIPVINYFSHN